MRRNDWPERLQNYIEKHQGTPFEWGVFDCVLFAAGAIEEMTGVDPAAEHRGHYRSQIGAARRLRKLGGIEAAATEHLLPISVYTARRGDIVQSAAEKSLGVCVGQLSFFPGEKGLVPLPTLASAAAWRVK